MEKKYHVVYKKIDEDDYYGDELTREEIFKLRKDKTVTINRIDGFDESDSESIKKQDKK